MLRDRIGNAVFGFLFGLVAMCGTLGLIACLSQPSTDLALLVSLVAFLGGFSGVDRCAAQDKEICHQHNTRVALEQMAGLLRYLAETQAREERPTKARVIQAPPVLR